MYYILYNPKSNAGKTAKKIIKFNKKLIKSGKVTKLINLLDEHDYLQLASLVNEDDIIVIVGGDGTIHNVVNNEVFRALNNKIYMYRCGRGNDFARDLKGKFFEITDLVKQLPHAYINDQKEYFVNGLGIGIDALTCQKQYENYRLEKKESYFKIAFRAFFHFKPFKLTATIDGKEYHYDNVWFFVVQNGKYFGGGMKISPKSNRLDKELEFVVIHNVGFKKLLCIFPLIFIGKHTIAKNAVKFITGHEFSFKMNYDLLQIDGEVKSNVKNLEVKR